MTLPRPTCRIVAVVIVKLRAKLLSYLRHSPVIDFCRVLGKPTMPSVKQEQQREPKAIRIILRHNDSLVGRGQCPSLGNITVIDHFFRFHEKELSRNL